jgi:ParB family transcriptional regulator, chromosome partitioning protein
MAKQRLGRGFDVLMPKDLDNSLLEEDKNRVQKILISDIIPNPEQPRRDFDENSLLELAESVKRFGVLQPIIVIRHAGKYKIVAGERRWRAAQSAKLSHIPAIVRSLEELEQVELALIENIQRVDLSPLEQALSVYRLQHQFNLSLEKIAQRLGKAHSTLSNLTRLLQLPESAREALRTGKISEGHSRAILALKTRPDKQEELLRCILNNKWSVRQAEDFVRSLKKEVEGSTEDKNQALVRDLGHKISAKVQLKRKKKGGQIIIHFDTEQQLEKIIQKL